MFVSRWCYKFGAFKVIGQFNHCKTRRVKIVSNHWSVLVSFDLTTASQIKSVCYRRPLVGFVMFFLRITCATNEKLIVVNRPEFRKINIQYPITTRRHEGCFSKTDLV